MQRRSEAELRALTSNFRERLDQARDDDAKIDLLDDLLPEAFAATREAAMRTIGQRHFDVQVMGGAALHFGWVAEMKTGEGKTLVATLPLYLNALARPGRAPHHRQRLPGQARRRVDGADLPVPRARGRHRPARRSTTATRSVWPTPPTSPTARTTSSGSTTSATTWPSRRTTSSSAVTSSPSSTRSTSSSSTKPARRSSSRVAPTTPQELYHQFAAIVKDLKRDRDYEVDEAKKTVVPTEEGVARVEEALSVDNLYEHVNQNFVHQIQAALARQGAVQARRRLRGAAGRGEDRRRVHRSHPRGPPLERGSAPGGRGQGAGADQGREPDPRDGHAPELLPHVRQARGHDRHRLHGGGRVRAHLRARGRHDPHQPPDGPRRRTPTSSTRARRRSSTPSPTTSPSATPRASRSSWARSRSRSRSCSAACSRSAASRTRC